MQNLGYSKKTRYSKAMSIYVGGTEAPEVELPGRRSADPAERAKYERRRKVQRAKALREANRRKMARLVIAGAVAGVMVLAGILLMINCVMRNAELSNEISALETTYNEAKAQNDSKEFELDQFVDINAVIKIATEELGMVRSSADQIVTYKTTDTEYIQQVADLTEN